MLSKWMQRLVFWSREKALRAKFRLYEHFPFLKSDRSHVVL